MATARVNIKRITSIELEVEGLNQIKVTRCDYKIDIKSQNAPEGLINLDLIFDETVIKVPEWVTDKKKFCGIILFKNNKYETVRKITFINAITDDFFGGISVTAPQEFIATVKLIVDKITLG